MLRPDQRADTGPGGGAGNHYQLRQQMLAIGDDYWIENEHGEKCYKVDGKALRIRQTLSLQDREGRELFKIQERMLRLKRTMAVEDASGQQVATVEKALVTLLRERWIVRVKDGPDLDVQGNVLDHEYMIGAGPDQVAAVSKKWFRLRDTYGVQVAPGQDDALILALAICIDQMAHRRR